MDIAQLLKAVPAVIWSGLVASFVTLMGVMLSNGSNTKRLLRQLQHDAEQKQRDRMAALHKEVYLKAAEELARASQYLGRISQIDPAKDNLADGLSELFAACAKAQLIAKPETSRLLGDLIAGYGYLLMRLIRDVMPVHDLNGSIRIASDFLARNQAEAQRALDEMKLGNESGNMSRERFTALQRSFENASRMADSFSEKRDTLWAQHAIANRNFNVAVFREMRAIGPVQAQAMAALRSELGLETDMNNYMKRMEEQWEKMDHEIKAVMDKLAEG